MEKAKFYKNIQIIFEDRNLTEPSELWLNTLYSKVTSLSDEQIIAGFKQIMCITAQDWNEKYGFRGKPAMIDWLSYFIGNKPIKIEDIARQEIEKILEEAKYGFSNWKSENPITAKVVNSYNKGLETIYFDLFDSFNSNRKDLSFYKKDMLQRWLNFEKSKDQVLEALEVERLNKLLPNFNKN
jgi:hypothetical protein